MVGMGGRWFVGIDWADQHHDVAVVDEQGRRGPTLRVAHSAEGLDELVTWLRVLAATDTGTGIGATDIPERIALPLSPSAEVERVACVVETRQGLLITALLDAGFPVYPVNPRTLQGQRAPAGAKTDALDAYLLARLGRGEWGELRRLAPDSALVRELRGLTRDQDGLIRLQTRLVNQLMACLKAYYPVALDLFAKLQQPSALAFLRRYPTVDAAQAASVEELAAFLRAQPHFPGVAAAAQRVHTRLQAPQLHADPVTVRTKTRLLVALVGQLEPLLEQIAAYDAAIAQLFAQHPDHALFASLPGTGTRLAPRLLAGWGDDRTRYASAASMQGLAGTAPVPWQSGKYAAARRRTACNKSLRTTLQQFAWHSTAREEWAQTYYRRKRAEGKSHNVAVRALANHWVRLIHAMWRTHTLYDAAIFRAAQQAHARPAA